MKHVVTLACLAALLVSCVPPPRDRPPPPRAKPRPAIVQDPAALRQCQADLTRAGGRYTTLPNQEFGNGCSQIGTVLLSDVGGVPVANLKAMRCPLARSLALWMRETVQPEAMRRFGVRVARVESMGSYACRNVIGSRYSGISEHATGNAVDIGGFVLADGRRITVKSGWQGPDDERDFLNSVREAACRRFQTVLSPDYNAAHHDHLHFDMGRGPFCR